MSLQSMIQTHTFFQENNSMGYDENGSVFFSNADNTQLNNCTYV